LTPQNDGFTEGKAWVMKKQKFDNKNQHSFFAHVSGGVRDPETLYFTRFLQDFPPPKKLRFGSLFGSVLDPQSPKTLYFTRFLKDFRGVFFEPEDFP
jgi:hypothetical protein